jgi:hypothetical protein
MCPRCKKGESQTVDVLCYECWQEQFGAGTTLKNTGALGWKCPGCSRCYSPFTSQCPYCSPGFPAAVTFTGRQGVPPNGLPGSPI